MSKVWFITGAGRGMGVDFARAALAAGHAVVASGRDRDGVSRALSHSDDLLTVKLDVTKSGDAEAAVRAAMERFGRIDVLVNNAASFYAGYFEELTPEQMERQLATSLIGPMNVTRAVLPVMRKQRLGHIISISSSAGFSGFEFGTAYAASKFGLEGWMESLHAELAPFGIATTIVNPGFGGTDVYFPDDIKTRFSDVWGQDHVLERVKENIVFLEQPEVIEEKGGYVPSGILLWGPPGTGKTLMAEAVAGETGKPFVFVDPGAFTNMFMGVGILKVKSLFRKLRKLALRYGGVIVFFDEADALGNRGAITPGFQGASPFEYDHLRWLSPHARAEVLRSAMPATLDPLPGTRRDGIIMGGMGGGGGMGTLQALLTELSGLKKPRGFLNRIVRRTFGMQPKPPPKYRILVMMATNMPSALDEALLRPGRIDRMYKVGYPSKDGRRRTYEGYLAKVSHDLTPEQVEKLAVITPYATGASIKDLVNEALICAIRDGRDSITWADAIKAKHLKALGPGEDVEYIERERHAIAIHEACHAVVAYRKRRHFEIDIATIEKGSDYLGMVASIPPEDQFSHWRSEYEADIQVGLASLAGERMFFGGDSSSGVSGDLNSATMLASLMEGHWGMGETISSYQVARQLTGGGGGGRPGQDDDEEKPVDKMLGRRVEANLRRLFEETEQLLVENRRQVLAVTHALERHKTMTGEDVAAVIDGEPGPLVDGRWYATEDFLEQAEAYHALAVTAHDEHGPVPAELPQPPVPDRHPAYVGNGGPFDAVPTNGSAGTGNGPDPYGYPKAPPTGPAGGTTFPPPKVPPTPPPAPPAEEGPADPPG